MYHAIRHGPKEPAVGIGLRVERLGLEAGEVAGGRESDGRAWGGAGSVARWWRLDH
jgi:hypothetical protein